MKMLLEPRPVLAICLSTAWQKTLCFDLLRHGEVNRAVEKMECGGGKGVNVVRVLRGLGFPVTFAGFAGGTTGEKLERELSNSGAGIILESATVPTRCCTTVISRDNSEVTELIEPSGAISPEESSNLLKKILSGISDFGAVVFSGSTPPGMSSDFHIEIARCAKQKNVPFILDAVNKIETILAEGIDLLKINNRELRKITGLEDIRSAGKKLLNDYPALKYLGVTNGPGTAFLFHSRNSWEFHLPVLPKVASAIGGGDCATAIMARRIAEDFYHEEMPGYFAEALACASASCLTETPSVFHDYEAKAILDKIEIVSL